LLSVAIPVTDYFQDKKDSKMQLQGIVTRFDPLRRFGFIQSPEKPVEIFFHLSSVAEGCKVAPGDTVTFIAVPDLRHGDGFKAINVRPIKEDGNV
jgi:cold shock CspA family protein